MLIIVLLSINNLMLTSRQNNSVFIFFTTFCPEPNIAGGGKVTQSSQEGTASPDKAIDGNHDSNVNHGSCSITLKEDSPWWRLDLLIPYKINTVTVTIRADGNYKSIRGAQIRIGNSIQNNGNANPR